MTLSHKKYRRFLRSTVALPLILGPISASGQSAAVEAALQDALRAARADRPDLTRQLESAARAARANPVVASDAAAPTRISAGSGLDLSTLGYIAGGVLAAGAGVAGAVAGGGGGDGGGGGGGTAPVYDYREAVGVAADYSAHGEYTVSQSLVNAAEGYAIADSAGAGQVIAILDNGVSSGATGVWEKVVGSASVYSAVGSAQPIASKHHGSQVASVAAASKGDGGFHGLAYDAGIFSARWTGGTASGGYLVGSGGYDRVATAIINSGASVFNASFGQNDSYIEQTDGTIKRDLFANRVSNGDLESLDAFAKMMNAGLVGVFAVSNKAELWNDTNNDGWGDTLKNGSYQAKDSDLFYAQLPNIFKSNPNIVDQTTRYFDYSGYEGMMLSVVNVSNSNAIVSQHCGGAMDWCVAAPGTNVATLNNNGTTVRDIGTSFAAPVVSGMVAVINSLYPFLSNRQIVSLIKNTAQDLGAPGVDSVFGHGLVDLGEALSFQGMGTVVTVRGAQASLPNTRAAAGPAFGSGAIDALADTTIVATDDYGRAFGFKLGAFVEAAREHYDFDAQFNAFMAEQDETDFAVGGFGFNLVSGEWQAGKPVPSTLFALSTENGYKLAASYDAPVSARFGLAAEGASSQTATPMGDSFASPLFSFAEGGLGFSGEIPLGGDGATLAFGMAQGQNAAPDSEAESFASVAEYRHPIGDGSSVRVSLGGLVEQNTVLGGETGGALAMADGAPTGFAGISAQFALGEGFSLIGAYHAGVTIAEPGEGSVYAAIDPLLSDSFSAGLRFDGDRVWGLASVSQPLRVARGSATLALPRSQNADGSLNYSETEADLSPDAREINLQLSGGTETSWGNVMVGGGARLNPNHVAEAAPEGLLFFKTTASF